MTNLQSDLINNLNVSYGIKLHNNRNGLIDYIVFAGRLKRGAIFCTMLVFLDEW